jgi:peptide chain release factor
VFLSALSGKKRKVKQMEKIIQITSGRGPAECCLAVALALKEMLKDASAAKLEAEVIARTPADQNGTLHSATIKVTGKGADDFAESWKGPLLWIAQSPYRKFHKRKNWFIGINATETISEFEMRMNEVKFQVMRASGPGGQHVNKTESAVRAVHLPSGIMVTASNSRSQYQNKKDALALLAEKVAAWNTEKINESIQKNWQHHNTLERGNAKRIYRDKNFIRIQ